MGVQFELVSATALHVSSVSLIGVHVSDVSAIAFHDSGVSGSTIHFTFPSIVIDESATNTIAPGCTLTASIATDDSASISTAWLTTTLVLTVSVPKSSIRIWIKGTRTASTVMALVAAIVTAPTAYLVADTLTAESAAIFVTAITYLSADTDMALDAATAADASATR